MNLDPESAAVSLRCLPGSVSKRRRRSDDIRDRPTKRHITYGQLRMASAQLSSLNHGGNEPSQCSTSKASRRSSFMLLPLELRCRIYDTFIIQNCILNVISPQSQPKYLRKYFPLKALSATCKQLQSEINEFLGKCRQDVVASPLIGFFIPATTTFLLHLSAKMYSSPKYDQRYKDFIDNWFLRVQARKVLFILEDEGTEMARLGMIRPWRMEREIEPLGKPWKYINGSLMDFRKVNDLRMRRVAYFHKLESVDVRVRWSIERSDDGTEQRATSLERIFEELCGNVWRGYLNSPVPRVRIFDERAGRQMAPVGVEKVAQFKTIHVEVVRTSAS